MASSCRENIKVLVRIRPLLARELDSDAVVQASADGESVVVQTESHNVKARFDHVFDTKTTQEQVYDKVKFAAESVAQGFNSTIFAYGQTGSGKSYTMFGPEDDLSIYGIGAKPSEAMGVIPRAIRDVMSSVEKMRSTAKKQGEDEDITIFCSFMQIYNDQPYDLLRDPNREKALEVHENTRSKEVYVVGLSEYTVASLDDCLALLEQGDEQRACRQTVMNDVSSRSHSVFQIIVERRKHSSGKLIRSKLNLVDLAGSEKWGKQEMLESGHLSELTNINSSLHTLGRCIAALTDPEASHVPFRDSKLTRILMDALGGNSRTCVIATLSSSDAYLEESISTLKFADRAKRVMQHARIIEQREVNLELVERLESEIDHLRYVLAAAGVDPTKYPRSGRRASTSSSVDDGGPAHEQEHPETGDTKESTEEKQRNALVELQKKLFEAEEKIRFLQNGRAADASEKDGNGSASGKPGNIAASKMDAIKTVLEGENKRLKQALSNIKSATGSFFRFEIEEDEFHQEFDRHLLPVQVLLSENAAAPLRRPNRSPRSSNVVYAGTAASFRLRGKSDKVAAAMVQPPPGNQRGGGSNEEKQTPLALLKEKQKELAKHKKLQQYLAEKAQRELDRIEADRKHEEDQERNRKSRDKQFQKHASLVKKKLIKLKKEHHNQNASQEQSDASSSINLPNLARPESRSSLFNDDTRPLSRQTIYEHVEEH